MEYRLVIPGKLHNLNDYISAERSNRYIGAQMKKVDQNTIFHHARRQLRDLCSWNMSGTKRTECGTRII